MKRMWMAVAVALLCAETAAAEVAQTMRHWWVECGPRGYCTAEVNGFSTDNDVLTFRLQRSEAENAPILVIVEPEHLVETGNAVTFDIPGHVEGMAGTVGPVSDKAFTYSIAVDNAFIDGLKAGSDLSIGIDFEGEMGRIVYSIPLAGAIDSLTVFDIAQQRLGRIDAVVARGAMPADSLSDIYPTMGEEMGGDDMGGMAEAQDMAADDGDQGDAHMEEGPNGSWFDLVYDPANLPGEVMFSATKEVDCANVMASLAEVGAGVRRDQQGRMWYMVPCDIGQANVSYFVVLHDPAGGIEYRQLPFELPITHNKPSRDKVLNLWYDNGRDRLIVTRFGNVNRNCGAYEEHAWVGDAQLLELQLYREKPGCGGTEVRPENWPVAWTIDEMGQ